MRCWSFQLTEEWHHCALDTKAAQLPLGNALPGKDTQLLQVLCKWSRKQSKDNSKRPSMCQGTHIVALVRYTFPVLYYNSFNMVFFVCFNPSPARLEHTGLWRNTTTLISFGSYGFSANFCDSVGSQADHSLALTGGMTSYREEEQVIFDISVYFTPFAR